MKEALTKRLNEAVALDPFYNNRIFWQTRPNGSQLPALTLQIAGDTPEYNHDGRDGLQEVRIQIDSRAVDHLTAWRGLNAVLSELEIEKTVGDVRFHEARKVSGSDAPKETLAGGTEVFRITMDVMVPFSAVAI